MAFSFYSGIAAEQQLTWPKNDGGVKLRRKDLIKEKGNENVEFDRKEFSENSKWKKCYLSNAELREPVVSDYKGHLFNKESILEYLLDSGESFTENQKLLVKHIKSLKDVVNLKMNVNKGNNEFICVISGNQLGSNGLKYIYLARCGDVMSEASLNIDRKSMKCPVCNEEYEDRDIIVINPESQQDIDKLEERMDYLKLNNLSHSLKKLKAKSKKRKEAEPCGGPEVPETSSKKAKKQ